MDSKAEPFLGSGPLPSGGRPDVIVWLFVGIVICLLGVAVFTSELLSSGRAFIAAESTWSKAQRDALFHLNRYALDRSEADLREYERAATVMEGERAARNELARGRPDEAALRNALTTAGVHPAEIDGLINLHDLLRATSVMDYILPLWQRSNVHVETLQRIARQLRAAPPEDPVRVARELQYVHATLKPIQEDFAQALNEMQRTAQSLQNRGILIIGAVLLFGGILLSRRFLAQNARLQQTLSESESQLRHLVKDAPLPLLIVRAADQQIVYANERALEQFALNFDSARAHSLADFYVEPENRAALFEQLSRQGSVRDFEVHLKDVSGRQFWLLLSGQPMRYEGAVCLLVALANIDDRKRMQEDMRRKAMHDTLTGLPNRAMFMESLERAIAKARRRSTRFSVLFIDLDRFKEVNDTMGHHAGDTLLQAVAQRLGTAVRQSDLVARLGGDEFVILIEEHGGPEEVMIVAQKALAMLQRPVTIDWREADISGSIGIASYPEDGTDVETLVRNADQAMYQAKERGRNNFQFYSAEINRLSHHRFEQEKRVRGALERNEFFLEYQPEFDLASGKVTTVEALLRWRDPVSGVVMPSDFMAMAEETGTVHAIGLWVLEQALKDLRGWRDHGAQLQLAVNVSARQLMQQDLVEEVQRLLAANGIEPQELRLEITEPTLMTDSEEVHRQVRALKGLGVEMAIDNFGTGYSSLGLVRGLPISVVKIDKSLVSSCPSRRECAAIVQAASAMSRVMGIRVVAEGVETEEQRRVMISLGCDAAQGFLFAKPIEPKRVPRLMDEKPTVPAAD